MAFFVADGAAILGTMAYATAKYAGVQDPTIDMAYLIMLGGWCTVTTVGPKKRRKEAKPDTYVPKGSPPPSTPVWCPKCDGLYTRNMMAWDLDGDDYVCGYCLRVPELLAVLGIWRLYIRALAIVTQEVEPVYNEDDELVGYSSLRGDDILIEFPAPLRADSTLPPWPGLGGPIVLAVRQFDENGLEVNANGEPLHLARYRSAGVTTNAAANAAYERGVVERARKRKARKNKENLMWRRQDVRQSNGYC